MGQPPHEHRLFRLYGKTPQIRHFITGWCASLSSSCRLLDGRHEKLVITVRALLRESHPSLFNFHEGERCMWVNPDASLAKADRLSQRF